MKSEFFAIIVLISGLCWSLVSVILHSLAEINTFVFLLTTGEKYDDFSYHCGMKVLKTRILHLKVGKCEIYTEE